MREVVAHKHQWKKAYTRGYDFIGLDCECGEKIERKATPRERRKIRTDQKRQEAQSAKMHGVNWEFAEKFKKYEDRGPLKIGKTTLKHNFVPVGWKYGGYDLMTRIRKWAKKYPKDVIVCGIDDSYNASSDLVFILHRIGKRLWGTTCYTVTQCDGQPPNEWFMYPGHRKGIQGALQAMAGFKGFYKGG